MKLFQFKYHFLLVAAALTLAGAVGRHTEKRRVAENLTMTDPANKAALDVGFLALGGFRGLLVDVLWVRAIRLQDASKYYELKLLSDLIQRLQPSFTGIHGYMAFNMSYNLASHATTAEDKWYWIRMGMIALEQGLERNKYNYSMWFEMGLQYADRLGNDKFGDYSDFRQKMLPNIDEIGEEDRTRVYSHQTWQPGHARADEYLRWAAYYFYKASQAYGDPLPIRTERLYGNCIMRLGHWRSKAGIPPAQRKWDDWGAEEWWLELLRRNEARGMVNERTIPQNLRWCMYEQIAFHSKRAEKLKTFEPLEAMNEQLRANDAEKRFHRYFPDDHHPMRQLMADFEKRKETLSKLNRDE